jgi:hypothetical protein
MAFLLNSQQDRLQAIKTLLVHHFFAGLPAVKNFRQHQVAGSRKQVCFRTALNILRVFPEFMF